MTTERPMWESMTREQLRDEAVRQAQIANGAMADADRLRDAAVRQARIAHDAMIEADTLRAALERAGRALNTAGWIDESKAALDAYRRSMTERDE